MEEGEVEEVVERRELRRWWNPTFPQTSSIHR